MSWGSRRLAAGVVATCAAGAATLAMATGSASAAPDGPVLAETCPAKVQGHPDQQVALASEVFQGEIGKLLAPLRPELPATFLIGEVGPDKLITDKLIVERVYTTLEPELAELLPEEQQAVRAALDESLADGCAIEVAVLPAEQPPPQQPPPQQPPPQQEPPQQEPPQQEPPRGTAPPEPSKPAPRPPAEKHDPPQRTPAEPQAPAQPLPPAPMLAPPNAPDAGALGDTGVPIFDSPLEAGGRVPGVQEGQDLAGEQAPRVQRAGHAVALPDESGSDRRDANAGLLAGVLALSGVLAGLVRATARRGLR